jgi:hypothetical protein
VPIVSLAQMAADYAAGNYGDNAKPDAEWKQEKGKGGKAGAMAH